ncbi:hypothetical protein [Nostoc sp.]|uniref:hypothetical protein n=1 Tax=Nostoc sp. TaxID=1180 RepID=UPI002FF75BB6
MSNYSELLELLGNVGCALALSADTIALSVDTIALSADTIALSVDTIALQVKIFVCTP